MGGTGEDYGANNYAAGQNLYNTGGHLAGDVGHPEYAYMEAGYNAAKTAKEQEMTMKQMIERMMIGGATPSSSSSSTSTYDPAQAEVDRAAAQADADERARISQGGRDRDNLYSSYMDAAGNATDTINKQISGERSNAALLGIDYNVTNDQKTQRINDYFGSIWGAGEQTQLEQLMGNFGNPAGFTDFLVTRGDGSNVKDTTGAPGTETVVASRGMKPTIAEEEETLGSAATILG
jgi:hypothetical protein